MPSTNNQQSAAQTNEEQNPQPDSGDFSAADELTQGPNNNDQQVQAETEGQNPDVATERDYENEAVALLNNICQKDEERATARYDKGISGRIDACFDQEGIREKSDQLDKVAEFKQNDEWKKWAKIGLKVAGGLGLMAAATFVGIPFVTPILWTIGVKKGWEGVLDAGERLGWGMKRTELELNTQAELSEKIRKLKQQIAERKAQNRGLTEAEYLALTLDITNADSSVAEIQHTNMSAEQSWAFKRAIASTVLTIGTAVIWGIPLGWRNYDHVGQSHKVFLNYNGSQFLYNPGEVSQAIQSNIHHYPLHFSQDFGSAAHTLGHGLPLLEKGAIFACGLYLYQSCSKAKKKKEERETGEQSTQEAARRREELAAFNYDVTAVPVVTKEMTLGDKKILSRKMALITLSQIRSYIELSRLDEHGRVIVTTDVESDAIFNQKTRELIKNIVIHGMGGGDRLQNHSDNDGEVSRILLQLAGFDISDIQYVEQGQFILGKLNIDTGNRHGSKAEGMDNENPYGQTFFFDHHGDETGNDISASEVTYETLVASKLLERTPALDKLASFITYIDNANHPALAQTFSQLHRTVLGLYRDMSAEELYRFFENGGDETLALTDDQIKAINSKLIKKSEAVRRENLAAQKKISDGAAEGLAIETPYGRAFVDIGSRDERCIKNPEAIFAHGYKIHIRWNPEQKYFFISGWPRNKALPQGKRVRGMWLKPHEDSGPVTIKLGHIIRALTNNQAVPTGKLLQYLQGELSGGEPRRSGQGGFGGRGRNTARGGRRFPRRAA